jgi:large subunit ribosomal protein L4
MKIDIFDESGKNTGKKIDLSDNVFNIKPHDHAIWLDIRSIRANQRQGTHDTKVRSEVAGGGAKPFRQKGTGNYHVGINKKVKSLARKSALSYKAKAKSVVVVEDFSYKEPKTNQMQKLLKELELVGKSILLLTGNNELDIHLSARNIYQVEVRNSITFSTYDVLRAEKLIIQESAVKKINEVLG